jgi:hypothetical protein
VFTPLHYFTGTPTDGSHPYAGLVQFGGPFGSGATFYGTTPYGGTNNILCKALGGFGCGTVFSLSVP